MLSIIAQVMESLKSWTYESITQIILNLQAMSTIFLNMKTRKLVGVYYLKDILMNDIDD